MVLRARESSAITLFKDFETLFAFLLNSLNDHYFGQYLVRLVVFLGDDERIFLLLFETIISQACKYVLRPPKRLTFQIVLFLATQPQFSQVCLSSLVTGDPHQPRLRAKTRTRPKLLGITKLAYRIYSSKRRSAYLFFVSPVRRLFNPWTYTQIHTITVVQEGRGGDGWNPSPGFLICCSISKRFYL